MGCDERGKKDTQEEVRSKGVEGNQEKTGKKKKSRNREAEPRERGDGSQRGGKRVSRESRQEARGTLLLVKAVHSCIKLH